MRGFFERRGREGFAKDAKEDKRKKEKLKIHQEIHEMSF
jgi:hypothetical protein